MAASYPSAAKSFTPIVDGVDYPQAAQVNAAYDEITAVETALVSTGLAHDLVPDATTRTLGTAAKPWGDAYLAATKKLYLDGGGDTYLLEEAANQVRLKVGGADHLVATATTFTVPPGIKAFIGGSASSNPFMTVGLTIAQGASDDEILAFKSTDISHAITSIADTDTYATFKKHSATGGGLEIAGYLDANVDPEGALSLRGLGSDNAPGTSKTTGSIGFVTIAAAARSGAGPNITDVGANANLLTVRNNATTRFILDSDGDSHQDVGTAWTNFDDGDDVARLDAVAVSLARDGDPLREEFLAHFEEKRAVIEAMPGKPLVSFNDDGHHFVNMSRLTMLLTGAARQLARENRALLARLDSLEQRLLPEAR